MAMLVECMKPGDDGDGVAALRSHPRPRSLQPTLSRVSRGHIHHQHQHTRYQLLSHGAHKVSKGAI